MYPAYNKPTSHLQPRPTTLTSCPNSLTHQRWRTFYYISQISILNYQLFYMNDDYIQCIYIADLPLMGILVGLGNCLNIYLGRWCPEMGQEFKYDNPIEALSCTAYYQKYMRYYTVNHWLKISTIIQICLHLYYWLSKLLNFGF